MVDRLRAVMIATALPKHLWCYVITAILELVNCTAVTGHDLTPHQRFLDELEPQKAPYIPDLSHYRAIGCDCLTVIPHEQRSRSQKLDAHAEKAKLLAVLGTKTYLIYLPTRNSVTKTSFIKLYEDSI